VTTGKEKQEVDREGLWGGEKEKRGGRGVVFEKRREEGRREKERRSEKEGR
jgi:hypothetical protein